MKVFFGEEGVSLCEQHTGHDVILNQTTQRTTVRWLTVSRQKEERETIEHSCGQCKPLVESIGVLIVGVDDIVGLGASELILWQVNVHFITIKISVVGVAVGIMHANGLHSSEINDILSQRPLEKGVLVKDSGTFCPVRTRALWAMILGL